MLHQIRKMVALAVAVMRGVASDNAISLCLDPRCETIPMERCLTIPRCRLKSAGWPSATSFTCALGCSLERHDVIRQSRHENHMADGLNGLGFVVQAKN